MGAILTGLALGLLFSTPWLAAIAWVCRQGDVSVFRSFNGEAFPTQAAQLRAFGPR
jgi:hypothetical protein